MSADDFAPVVREPDPAEQADREEAERPVPGSPESKFKARKIEHYRPGCEPNRCLSFIQGEPSVGEMIGVTQGLCQAEMQPVLSRGGDLIGYHCRRCGATAGPEAAE